GLGGLEALREPNDSTRVSSENAWRQSCLSRLILQSINVRLGLLRRFTGLVQAVLRVIALLLELTDVEIVARSAVPADPLVQFVDAVLIELDPAVGVLERLVQFPKLRPVVVLVGLALLRYRRRTLLFSKALLPAILEQLV